MKRLLFIWLVLATSLCYGNRVANKSAGSSLYAGLVGDWKADEASGTMIDSVGGNDLTQTNGVTSATGVLNGARQFIAASSQYVSHADAPALRFDTDFTISCWVWMDSDTTLTQTFISKFGSGTGELEFELTYAPSATQFRLRFYDASGTGVEVYDTNHTAPSFGAWYNIVCILDSDTLSIRSNAGTPVTVDASGLGARGGTSPFVLGETSYLLPAFPVFMNGRIDEVKKWNRAITSGEVTTLFGGGTPPASP